MRKILLVAALAVASLIPAVASAKHVPVFEPAPKEQAGPVEDFSETLSKATLEMYVGKQVCGYVPFQTVFGTVDGWTCKFVAKPICTATVVFRDGEHYGGVSVGHCVVPELYKQGWEYYVSSQIADNPVLDKISIAKWDNTERYDYLAFSFKSLRDYPVIEMAGKNEDIPAIGTEVLNANFTLGIVKQVNEGRILSSRIGAEASDNKGLVGRYFVNIGVGPGASGSAIVDKKTHKIVGLVEAIFPGTTTPTAVVPMGKPFYDFADDDSVVAPQPPPNGQQFRQHVQEDSRLIKILKWLLIAILI